MTHMPLGSLSMTSIARGVTHPLTRPFVCYDFFTSIAPTRQVMKDCELFKIANSFCYVAEIVYVAVTRARHQHEAGLSVHLQGVGQCKETYMSVHIPRRACPHALDSRE